MADIYTNLVLIIFGIIAIFLTLLWRWYKLKDAGEGDHDLIDMALEPMSNVGLLKREWYLL